MLVNLCGPPCSGKTTLSKIFCNEHPDFWLLAIDDYRIKHKGDDLEAWFYLAQDAEEADNCIVESSGVSNLLETFILSNLKLMRRGICTLILTGEESEFLQRLEERKSSQEKQEIPFQHSGLSEKGLIERFDTLIEDKHPLATRLNTTFPRYVDAAYSQFENWILKKQKEFLEATSAS